MLLPLDDNSMHVQVTCYVTQIVLRLTTRKVAYLPLAYTEKSKAPASSQSEVQALFSTLLLFAE
jgi:hypothetical protein